mmetsp:Transcript_40496/g.38992  ORF Transcript_40496/g.38992 Transcript_40496/m.38992 type:complete len:312 (-) Transcript_40496:150-1085(-)
MVGDIDILEEVFIVFFMSILEVLFDFLLHDLPHQPFVPRLIIHLGMFHLELFEPKAQAPLPVEPFQLLIGVEGRGDQFLPPERGVTHLVGREGVSDVGVDDLHLVVASEVEGPDELFVHPLVDGGDVAVGGVGVDVLSEDVRVDQLLVVVLQRHHGAVSGSGPVLRLERLHPLPLIEVGHVHVVYVVQEVRILLNGLVEACEGSVQNVLVDTPVYYLLQGHVQTHLHQHSLLLLLVAVYIARCVGPSQPIVNSVLMDSPHVVDPFIDKFPVVVLAEDLGSSDPEKHVPSLQLEERGPHSEPDELIASEGHC